MQFTPDLKRRYDNQLGELPLANRPHANADEGDGGGDGNDVGIATKTKPKLKKPSLYRVLLLNDDYTPMEFVVHVLERFFQKNRDQATQIMLHVH
ncbi:MAG: ATP-dependent Clp protease adaptor ClpS, partial [Pseudomonadota bacterium]